MQTALADQDKILKQLLNKGSASEFGKEHHLNEINDYQSFIQAIPIRDY
jgi:hypothetical protein